MSKPMNSPTTALLAAALLCATAHFAPTAARAADLPRLIPFQGVLTNQAGAVVADGTYKVQFKLFDAPTGGANVWNGEVQILTVRGRLVDRQSLPGSIALRFQRGAVDSA